MVPPIADNDGNEANDAAVDVDTTVKAVPHRCSEVSHTIIGSNRSTCLILL